MEYKGFPGEVLADCLRWGRQQWKGPKVNTNTAHRRNRNKFLVPNTKGKRRNGEWSRGMSRNRGNKVLSLKGEDLKHSSDPLYANWHKCFLTLFWNWHTDVHAHTHACTCSTGLTTVGLLLVLKMSLVYKLLPWKRGSFLVLVIFLVFPLPYLRCQLSDEEQKWQGQNTKFSTGKGRQGESCFCCQPQYCSFWSELTPHPLWLI